MQRSSLERFADRAAYRIVREELVDDIVGLLVYLSVGVCLQAFDFVQATAFFDFDDQGAELVVACVLENVLQRVETDL